MPIMGVISSALDDEKQLETANKRERDNLIARSKGQDGQGGPVSLLNGPSAAGYTKIGTPN
jgi:hypothetical protein